jgi:hypothetical protein
MLNFQNKVQKIFLANIQLAFLNALEVLKRKHTAIIIQALNKLHK